VAVAREGEAAEPRLPAPTALRPILGFSRLSSASYTTIRRTIDADDAFRARVAETAREPEVGRAGWLWLHRPEDWRSDPAFGPAGDVPDAAGLARLRRERDGAEAAAARARRAAEEADQARRRTQDELERVRRQAAEAFDERAALRSRSTALGDERNQAVRALKAVEVELADTRRDLRAARQAAHQAEAELLTEQGIGHDAVPRHDPVPPNAPTTVAAPRSADHDLAPSPPGGDVVGSTGPDTLDRAAAQQAIAAAATAASELARALGELAAVVGPPVSPADAPPAHPSSTDPCDDPSDGDPSADPSGYHPSRVNPSSGVGSGREARPSGRPSRRAGRTAAHRARPSLPPGVFDGSREAHRHLVTSSSVMVVVDGYNLARSAWTGLAPEEERRRTVVLLEELRARSGAAVVVVFDGRDHVVAPGASRSVRVRFSATGETADEAIADLVGSLPPSQPVVVVSSDREVAADARRHGATVLEPQAFLDAVGR
jgi:predicted RNA-binding protein with PIN domain